MGGGTDGRRAAIALASAAAAATAAAAVAWYWPSLRSACPRRLRNLLGRTLTSYDGLDSAVSQSARSIAALRALEKDEPSPLFVDPFAEAFAGEAAMAKARASSRRDGRIAGASPSFH